MGWLVDNVVNKLVSLILSLVSGAMVWVTSLFSGIFGSDPSAFLETFPIVNGFSQAFYVVGIVLCISLFILACFRNMFSGLGFAGENPFKMVFRFLIAFALVFLLPMGMNLIYSSTAGKNNSLFGSVYDALGGISSESMDGSLFAQFNSGNITSLLTNGLSTLALSLVALILLVVIGINLIKLLLEMTERYLMVNVMIFFSPLVGAAATLESTAKIFSTYLKMFFGQMIMIIMNLISCKLITSAMTVAAESFASGGQTPDFPGIEDSLVPFVVLLIIIAMLKICQRFDNYLRDIGITVGITGGSLMDEISSVGHGAILSTATGALFGRKGKGSGGGGGSDSGIGILGKAGLTNTARGGAFGALVGAVQDARTAHKLGKDPTSEYVNKDFGERFAMASTIRRGAGSAFLAGATNSSKQRAADTVETMMNGGTPISAFAARIGGNAVGFNELVSSGKYTSSFNPNGVKLDSLKDVRVGAGGAVGIDKNTGHLVAFTTEKPAFESSTLTQFQGENGVAYYAQDLTIANQEYQAETGVNYGGYVDTLNAYQGEGPVDFRESSYKTSKYTEPTKSYQVPEKPYQGPEKTYRKRGKSHHGNPGDSSPAYQKGSNPNSNNS